MTSIFPPQKFEDPKIICLNIELELKAERDNAEIRIDKVSEYQAIVDAEWQIIYDKLEKIVATGAKCVLSKVLPDFPFPFPFPSLSSFVWFHSVSSIH